MAVYPSGLFHGGHFGLTCLLLVSKKRQKVPTPNYAPERLTGIASMNGKHKLVTQSALAIGVFGIIPRSISIDGSSSIKLDCISHTIRISLLSTNVPFVGGNCMVQVVTTHHVL